MRRAAPPHHHHARLRGRLEPGCGGMAGRGRRAWLSVLLGLVLGFVLASRLVLPRASELAAAARPRRARPLGCRPPPPPLAAAAAAAVAAASQPRRPGPQARSFLFVGVMTAQKYLRSRAVAAHR